MWITPVWWIDNGQIGQTGESGILGVKPCTDPSDFPRGGNRRMQAIDEERRSNRGGSRCRVREAEQEFAVQQ